MKLIYEETTGMFAVKRDLGKWALARSEDAQDCGSNAG